MKPVCTKDSDYPNHTLLIVDNSPDKLNVIVKYLTDCGFKVISARNGETALDLAQSRQPDLILLDTMLPGIDGFETCRLLKANQSTHHMLIIFMTQVNQPENTVKGFELGAVDYITKPFHKEELLARVTTHLQLKDLTENLETKVREQTGKLRSANKKLYQKIKEKDAIAAALQESESRYRAVIENANDGIGIMEAGRIVFINEKMLEIFGYNTRQDLIHQHISILFHPDEKDRISRYNEQREAGTAQVPLQYEAKGITRQGHKIYLGISATRITYQDRIAVLAFFKDLTRHKQLEGQLQQAQKMEAIGTLAGGIAHDFNNILSIIIGHTELCLLDDTLSSGTSEYLNRVLNASRRASDLVHQILTFSRQKGMEPKPLNISQLVKETLKMLRASIPSTIEIRSTINDSESLIMADSTQIHQVVLNLCTNASHAMPHQGGILEVTLNSVDIGPLKDLNLPGGPYLKLCVSDNGHGMDELTVNRIFNPYFTTKKSGEGTGLGLAVVHGIVTHYNGFIKVESSPGKGSKFDVFLPVVENPAVSDTTELGIEELPRGNETILFVDDEEMVVTLYQDMISFLGYRITAVSSSREAWQLFKTNPDAFDLVITDLTMPHLSGDELSRKMIRLRPDIPIILCTGHSNCITEAETAGIGIRQFLTKPVILDHLAFTIRDVLDAQAVCRGM